MGLAPCFNRRINSSASGMVLVLISPFTLDAKRNLAADVLAASTKSGILGEFVYSIKSETQPEYERKECIPPFFPRYPPVRRTAFGGNLIRPPIIWRKRQEPFKQRSRGLIKLVKQCSRSLVCMEFNFPSMSEKRI